MARGSRRWWGQTQEVTEEGGHGLVSCLPGSFRDGEELMSALAELRHVQREHGGGAFWGLSSSHLWPFSWKVLECQSCLQGENSAGSPGSKLGSSRQPGLKSSCLVAYSHGQRPPISPMPSMEEVLLTGTAPSAAGPRQTAA